jgi:hypothetical protein
LKGGRCNLGQLPAQATFWACLRAFNTQSCPALATHGLVHCATQPNHFEENASSAGRFDRAAIFKYQCCQSHPARAIALPFRAMRRFRLQFSAWRLNARLWINFAPDDITIFRTMKIADQTASGRRRSLNGFPKSL